MAVAKKICLVVPCFNEASRLDRPKFMAISDQITFIFVNDGSNDNTKEVLTQIAGDRHIVLDMSKNSGKAAAVRHGMLYSRTQLSENKFDWIGYWDADLATSLEEVQRFLIYREALYPQAQVIWGSRVLRIGGDIRRSGRRHYLGRIFATLVTLTLGVYPYDTQCGAKLFAPQLLDVAFGEPFMTQWIFDVEILERLLDAGAEVVEFPLTQWIDITGSKVKIMKSALRVISDLIRLRKKYGYRSPRPS